MRPSRWASPETGQWLYYTGPLDAIPDDRWQEEACVPCTLRLDRGARTLLLLDGTDTAVPFDAAFPVLHGKNGEDGTLQGLLELAGVPVIGCGALSSALCMDKDRAHKLAALARREGAPQRPLPPGRPSWTHCGRRQKSWAIPSL